MILSSMISDVNIDSPAKFRKDARFTNFVRGVLGISWSPNLPFQLVSF